MKRGSPERLAGLPSVFKARRRTNWLMTVLTVNATSRSLRGMFSSGKNEGVIRSVRVEQAGVVAANGPELVLEEPREVFTRDRADALVAGNVPVGPVAQ